MLGFLSRQLGHDRVALPGSVDDGSGCGCDGDHEIAHSSVGMKGYHALFVGAGHDTFIKDAEDIAQALRARGYSTTLLTGQAACKDSIEAAVMKITSKTIADEVVFIFLSLHGVPGDNGDLLIAPHGQ